eukprot:IDg4429t1
MCSRRNAANRVAHTRLHIAALIFASSYFSMPTPRRGSRPVRSRGAHRALHAHCQTRVFLSCLMSANAIYWNVKSPGYLTSISTPCFASNRRTTTRSRCPYRRPLYFVAGALTSTRKVAPVTPVVNTRATCAQRARIAARMLEVAKVHHKRRGKCTCFGRRSARWSAFMGDHLELTGLLRACTANVAAVRIANANSNSLWDTSLLLDLTAYSLEAIRDVIVRVKSVRGSPAHMEVKAINASNEEFEETSYCRRQAIWLAPGCPAASRTTPTRCKAKTASKHTDHDPSVMKRLTRVGYLADRHMQTRCLSSHMCPRLNTPRLPHTSSRKLCRDSELETQIAETSQLFGDFVT